MPDFLKDPYGDPYVSEEMRDFASNLGDSDNENDENIDEADEEELEQIKSALEEEDGSGKYRNMLWIFPKNWIIRTVTVIEDSTPVVAWLMGALFCIMGWI